MIKETNIILFTTAIVILFLTSPALGTVYKIGLVTDVHQGNHPCVPEEPYPVCPRQAVDKMTAAITQLVNVDDCDVIVDLGDFIHLDPWNPSPYDIVTIINAYNQYDGNDTTPRIYALGNHDMAKDYVTKSEFLAEILNASNTVNEQDKYFSYDLGNLHLVVLDSCYNYVDGEYIDFADPNGPETEDEVIPPVELEWLDEDLTSADNANKFSIILAHQFLNNEWHVSNAPEARAIFEKHRVIAVLTGHSHSGFWMVKGYNSLGRDILYHSFEPLGDGDYDGGAGPHAHSRLDVNDSDGTFTITGYDGASDSDWVYVTNFSELEVAVHDNKDTLIYLKGTPFTMTEDLFIDYDCKIRLVYDGNVTIDGADSYNVTVSDGTTEIGNVSDNYRLIFTQADYGTYVRSYSSVTNVTFHYCDFRDSYAPGGNGLTILSGDAASIDVTCNNCNAFNNYNDGFSMSSGTVNNNQTLTLNNCKAYDNGTEGIPASGDGATCRNSRHTLIINGGEYYSNGKSGVSTVGGKVYCYGGTYFHDNSDMSQGHCDVFVEEFGLFDGAIFDNDNVGTTRMYCEFYGSGTTGILTNCVFKDLNVNTGVKTQVLLFDCKFLMTNCVFYGAQGTTCSVFTWTDTTGLISNCTFYGNYRGIRIRSIRLTLVNNIISGFSNYGIYDDSGCYSNNSFNGYNCWYNNGANLGVDGGSIASTDIEADPQFVDAAGGDFRLKPTSPCVNAGKPTLDGRFTDIGAWQGGSFVRYLPPNCTVPLAMDFNDDCKVNFQDFVIFSQSWLECNLEPPEACWE